ncbi:MAG: hypothetical protein R3F60_29320 [bacterium]
MIRRLALAFGLLASSVLPAAAFAGACPVGELPALEVIGPLPDVPPAALPDAALASLAGQPDAAIVPGLAGPAIWRPAAEGTCGAFAPGSAGTVGGMYLARARVRLPGRGVAALHVAVGGAARVFWAGRLVGVVADGREVFELPGEGALPLLIEVRTALGVEPRLALRWTTPDGAPLDVQPADQVDGRVTPPSAPIALPLPAPPALGPVPADALGLAAPDPMAPPVVLPPPPDLPPVRRDAPLVPGQDVVLEEDHLQIDRATGQARRTVRLRIQTPAGVDVVERLLVPTGTAGRLELARVRRAAGWAALEELGELKRWDAPAATVVGDRVDLEWRSSGDPGGYLVVRSAALATLAWSVKCRRDPAKSWPWPPRARDPSRSGAAGRGTPPAVAGARPPAGRRHRAAGRRGRPCGVPGRLAGPACSGARPRPR